MSSFDQVFGWASQINYNEDLGFDHNPISLPEPTDTMEEAVEKFKAVVLLVQNNKSIAAHAGFELEATEDQKNRASGYILSLASPLEKLYFEAWKRGDSLPNFDWATDHIQIDPRSLLECSLMENKARTLQFMYQHEGITATNAKFVIRSKPYMAAMTKVVGRYVDHLHTIVRTEALRDINIMDPIELGLCRKVIATATNVVNRAYDACDEESRPAARELLSEFRDDIEVVVRRAIALRVRTGELIRQMP